MPRTYGCSCKLCGAAFVSGTWGAKYCSKTCRTSAFSTGHADYNCGDVQCRHCGATFAKKHLRHAYCTPACKTAATRARRLGDTAEQYARISGNWRRYFLRLCSQKRRDELTPELLQAVLERQQGLCALTGVPLTCDLKKGERTWTNASIDRIVPGGPYIADNIRLTCARINILRGNMADAEFLSWCQLVLTWSHKDATKP